MKFSKGLYLNGDVPHELREPGGSEAVPELEEKAEARGEPQLKCRLFQLRSGIDQLIAQKPLYTVEKT